jgi:hypothetical protein
MSDHLHEPGEDGDVIDQAQLDMAEGVSPSGPAGFGPLEPDAAPPGHPGATTPVGTPGEVGSRGGDTPAGPTSATTGTAGGTGAGRDEAAAPPSAPG